MNRTSRVSTADVARAVDADELRLHLQPLVTAHGRQCTGFEALVRWQHPTLGLLGPDAFVPVIEPTDTIGALTEWVLHHAIAACARWRSAGSPYTVSVNVSARLVGDEGLPDRIDGQLRALDLAPHALTVEITESSLAEDTDAARRMLAALRRRGIRISVDDFGTGYTSLAMLRAFEFDELKIDGSFIANLSTSPTDGAIVRSILELGHRLGLDVVAEHVEDEITARTLTELGCDMLQGYHFDRPRPVDEALDAAARLCALAHPLQVASGAVPAPRTPDEDRRLEVLHELAILDTDPEPIFDSAATIAAAICGTPTGLVTFVDGDRQWFKARHGLDATGTDRDSAFCSHAILHDAILEVPDAHGDARFRENPLVTGSPHIRFYAGAPLITDDGHALGTLCVLDSRPHTLSDDQRAGLEHLAAIVVDRLGARRREIADRDLTRSLSTLPRLHGPDDIGTAATTIATSHRRLLGADVAALWLPDHIGSVVLRPAAVAAAVGRAIPDVPQIDRRRHGDDLAAILGAPGGILERRSGDGPGWLEIGELLGARQLVAHPLQHGPDVLGILVSWWDRERPGLDAPARERATLLVDTAAATITRLNTLTELQNAAHTDALTGLANRRACVRRLRTMSSGSAIALVDLDRFASVNDVIGHQAADLVLKTFASHLRNAARTGDLVGRWGDEEFLIAVQDGGTNAATDVVARLRSSWRHPIAPTTFSAGITALAHDETVERAIERADRALHHAKQQGRDRTVVDGAPPGTRPDHASIRT